MRMAGGTTTTSNGVWGTRMLNATSVALPGISTAATGTTVIGAGDISGPVTQSGTTAISTGTLTANTGGSVTLSNSKPIPLLGAIPAPGGFTLHHRNNREPAHGTS